MFRRTFLSVITWFPFAAKFCGNVKSENRSVLSSDKDVVMEAISEASMCWEYPERAGVFDSVRAIEIGNRVRQHFADGIGDFATARRRVCDDMGKDEGLKIAYQSNIAMRIFDNSSLNHESCNRIADKIMCVVFDLRRLTLPQDLDKSST